MSGVFDQLIVELTNSDGDWAKVRLTFATPRARRRTCASPDTLAFCFCQLPLPKGRYFAYRRPAPRRGMTPLLLSDRAATDACACLDFKAELSPLHARADRITANAECARC